MPTLELRDGTRIRFAGKDEVLAYANRIREAGGANALDALLPSDPNQSSSCLIARALNFSCQVYPEGSLYIDGSRHWVMELPDAETTRRVAKAMKARVVRLDGRLVMRLPKRIGNAAAAFDSGHDEFADLIR